MRAIYKSYQKLLDEQLKNTTLLIFIVTFLIISTGVFLPKNSLYAKNNILEANKSLQKNIIEIDGKKYIATFVLINK